MKKNCFSLLCILFHITLTAPAQIALQNKIDPRTYLPFKIALNNEINQPVNNSFFLKLYDNRDDTNRIGFFKGDGYTYYAFEFKESPMPYLSRKLNDNIKDAPDTLHVVFRKIWIYEATVPVRKNFEVKGVASRIEASLYFKRGDIFYLYQTYDSTAHFKGYIGSRADDVLSKAFLHFRHNAYSLPESPDLSKLQKFEELPSLISNYPILQTKIYSDGVYRNLQDFANNDPLRINFNYVVKKNKEKLILQNALPGDSIYGNIAWGFCKDGIAHMRMGDSYSKLTKIEHSFELRTFDLARYTESSRLNPAGVVTGATISAILFPQILGATMITSLIPPNKKFEAYSSLSSFKLDLSTGEIY